MGFQGDMVGEERCWVGMEKEAKQSLNSKDISEGWIMSGVGEKRIFPFLVFGIGNENEVERRMKMRFFCCGGERFLCATLVCPNGAH